MQGGKIAVVRFLEVKEGSLGSSTSHMIRVDGSPACLDGDVAKILVIYGCCGSKNISYINDSLII